MWDIWPQLVDEANRPLVEAVAGLECVDAAAIGRLRRDWPADLVTGALDLVAARRKAADKFDAADLLVADAAGVEQASSLDVARHKARRFADAGIDDCLDLCCGIGGDAMGLAEIGAVTVVDSDATRVWMARHNVKQVTGREPEAVVADVTEIDVAGRAFHIDPDRRAAGRRSWKLADMQPGLEFIERLVREGGHGAIKLTPGVDFDELAECLDATHEVEIISRCGTLVQAVAWTGDLARHERSATIMPAGVSLHGEPGWPPICTANRYLHTADPSAERAELLGVLCDELDVGAIHPALGLLTGDEALTSPWVRSFELVERMPWRARKVKAWLTAHDGGIVEVKTRGQAVDPNAAARQLRGQGDTPYTVFVLRHDRQVIAWITRRVVAAD